MMLQTAIILFVLVLAINIYAEKYVMLNRNYTLDSHWNVRRLSNTRKQTKDPFNTCSPESYDECTKNNMPHLSRY